MLYTCALQKTVTNTVLSVLIQNVAFNVNTKIAILCQYNNFSVYRSVTKRVSIIIWKNSQSFTKVL
jgi:hypothetical protein